MRVRDKADALGDVLYIGFRLGLVAWVGWRGHVSTWVVVLLALLVLDTTGTWWKVRRIERRER